MLAVAVAALAGLSAPAAAFEDPWAPVDAAVQAGVDAEITPGAVAAVAGADGLIYLRAFGRLDYDPDSLAVTVDTNYDIASLTKVTATTTAAGLLYQWGLLDLDEPVSSAGLLGADFAAAGKGAITPRNLLLHNSGFPPDPTVFADNYWNASFPCGNNLLHPVPQAFNCTTPIYEALLAQPLDNPVGAEYVYSDLSMITMMYVVGHLARANGLAVDGVDPACLAGVEREDAQAACYFEAFVDEYVVAAANMTRTGFRRPQTEWATTAPTWDETDFYRYQQIQGFVSDGNAYALGGISGHAGLFSSAPQLVKLMHALMFSDALWDRDTFELFTTVADPTFSSRALGWDTNGALNTYRGCGTLSNSTFTHTGFTGTEICGDPERELVTVLLTNRCFPDMFGRMGELGEDQTIQDLRQAFNSAVQGVWDSSSLSGRG